MKALSSSESIGADFAPQQQIVVRKLGRRNSLRPDFSQEKKHNKIYEIMAEYLSFEPEELQKSICNHLEFSLAITRFMIDKRSLYRATALSIRDRLIERWNDTQYQIRNINPKRVYYLSLEFLLGRAFQNSVINIGIEGNLKDALLELGYQLEDLYDQEYDPALGNGGLGRLAACFLDSLATLNYPATGYGLRYSYGIFRQKLVNGYQIEVPDYWLNYGNPWEIPRLDVKYLVKFYGSVTKINENGKEYSVWSGGEEVLAQAYDNPIPGYNTWNTINLRLWKSTPINEIDLSKFNSGDYMSAIEDREKAEHITSILYPNDNTMAGKELRLKQQYFFVCATLQDIIRRFKAKNQNWKDFPDKVAIQLNDTHPALGIIELMRILVDIENLDWEESFKIAYKTFGYTNHTVLPEALEKWPVELVGKLLPRHLEIIYRINFDFMGRVAEKYPGDFGKMSRMSLIEEGDVKKVRMANLCIVGSHSVNGVAALHSSLLTTTIFKDFYEMFKNKFCNRTNGVTPRRWVRLANPSLGELYTKYLTNENWVRDFSEVKTLMNYIDNPDFKNQFLSIKKENKKKLVDLVFRETGIKINQDSLFDIMVKRLHEYKRQFLNILYVIHRYLTIKELSASERKKIVPRTVLIGGKAAPGYYTAKKIIKLISNVSNVINNDKEVGDLLKVVFFPNYNVSSAEIIIPASDLSQHISTAGMEASGTSNMKFTMNGCLIIGTMDGANVEIAEEIGKENMFIFGALVEDVEKLRHHMKNTAPNDYFSPKLLRIFKAIDEGMFGNRDELNSLVDTIRWNNDHYLVGADFEDYCRAQELVDASYLDQEKWGKMAITASLKSIKFSSDRTIIEYAKDTWGIEPVQINSEQQLLATA